MIQCLWSAYSNKERNIPVIYIYNILYKKKLNKWNIGTRALQISICYGTFVLIFF